MRRMIPVFVLTVLAMAACGAYAQDDEKREGSVPPGMEIIQVGPGNRLLVPEGTRTQRMGALMTREFTEEYAARRFSENEERFAKIEANFERMKAKIEELEVAVAALRPAEAPPAKEKSE